VCLRRTPCAGGIVFDAQRRLLLIRRGRPPALGAWSIPGGRCEPGEAPEVACVREVREETGLSVRVLRHAGQVDRPGPGGVVFGIDDYVCEMTSGHLAAGDDAADVRWVTLAQLNDLLLAPGLLAALTAWRALPD
jgi:8-oxo-dGTP diphosphatase